MPLGPALRMREVTVRYAATPADALRGVSFEMAGGGLVTIAGRTGAGASTLALAAAGFIPRLVRATVSGEIELGEGIRPAIVLGRPASQLTGARTTVREEIAFGLENLGVPHAEMDDRIDVVMAGLGIEGLAERSPERLSGGEQQRVAIAAILAMAPGLLVLDEPTSHLDAAGAAALAGLLAEAAEAGTAVLAADHDPGILGRSGRTLLLDGGRIVADDVPGAALQPERAAAAGYSPPAIARLAAAAGVAPALAFDEAAVAAALAAGAGQAPAEPPMPPPLSWQPVRAQPPAAVEIAGLVHRYPDGTEALRGVDLSIRAGAAVAIAGANGSGKTTLAKHLNGLLRPTAGSVRVAGTDVAANPVHRNAGIVGFGFSDPDDMLFARTVEDEVRFGPRNLGLPIPDVDQLVDAALEATGFAGRRRANPHDLAPADRRLVALAAVLATDPALLVLDEPTSGLDPAGAALVGAIVDGVRAAGRTVIAITHDVELAARHFERIVVLRDGEVVLDGTPREVFAPGRAATLASAGLRPPVAARIAAHLGLGGVPLDAAELVATIWTAPGSG